MAFSVSSSNYDAEYGHTSGGVVNLSTLSGTDQYHGMGWSNFRRTGWDANSFQNKYENSVNGTNYGTPFNTETQLGFQVGGPIAIPHLVAQSTKYKPYFFFAFDHYTELLPRSLLLSYPTAQMRTGDFSQLLNQPGYPSITINDPDSVHQNTQGIWVRDPFPGNIIPAGRLNPVAVQVAKLFPTVGTTPTGQRVGTSNLSIPNNYFNWHFYNLLGRFDFNVGDKYKFYLRPILAKFTEVSNAGGIVGPGENGGDFSRASRGFLFDFVDVVNPKTVLNLRAGYTNFAVVWTSPANQGFDLTKLGLPSSLTTSLQQQAGHSQLIHQVRSYDGIHWQDSTFTIASTVQADRPGMAVVTKLPNATYFMSYELCGPAACTVFDRISPDGWNWGDPTNMGNRVVTAAGQWLEHAPTNAWAPSVASANGTILLVGQMMYDSDGQVSSGNGVTILTNHTVDGTGAWSTMPAPVQVPNAYNNYCPNYSSPLLPSVDGQSVLEFASAYNGSTCEMYFGTGPILAGTLTPTVTVTPPAGSTTTAQAVSVTISVSGTLSVTPIGTVTISAGNYTSTPATLTNGTATVTIPANELSAGTVTLTANYSGDANYTPASGSAPATITQAPTFSISAPSMTLKRGATTGNTATITVTPAGGFTGTVTLSAQIASGPAGATLDYPTLAFGASNMVSITSASPGTATLTILTTAAANTQARNAGRRGSRFGAVSLCFILFGLPFTIRLRRSGARFLVLLLASIVIVAGGISGCNGNGGSSTVAAPPGTLPGTYVINVSGSSPNASATGLFTLTLQ